MLRFTAWQGGRVDHACVGLCLPLYCFIIELHLNSAFRYSIGREDPWITPVWGFRAKRALPEVAFCARARAGAFVLCWGLLHFCDFRVGVRLLLQSFSTALS